MQKNYAYANLMSGFVDDQKNIDTIYSGFGARDNLCILGQVSTGLNSLYIVHVSTKVGCRLDGVVVTPPIFRN